MIFVNFVNQASHISAKLPQWTAPAQRQAETNVSIPAGRAWAGNYRHLFKEAVRGAGLSDRIVFHSLRYTYANQLVQAGPPLPIIAQQLGHATTDTVSRTYGHLAPSTLEAEIRSRFAPLDPSLAAEADRRRKDLKALSVSLQGGGRDTAAELAWPRSNFCRGGLVSVRHG